MDAVSRHKSSKPAGTAVLLALLLAALASVLQGCVRPALDRAFLRPEIIGLECPETAMIEEAVVFSALLDTTGAGPVRIVWRFSDGERASGEPRVRHAFDAPGTYSVTVTVLGRGGRDRETCTVRAIMAMAAPIPGDDLPRSLPVEFVATASTRTTDTCADTPPITFDLSASVADVTVAWNFGDGDGATGPQVPHRYAERGVYAVTVTVVSALGRSTVEAGHVRVYPCLPMFRWELPRTFVDLTRDVRWADGRRPTFEDIDRKIAAALRDAGFDDGRRRYFLYPEGGFVIVTQLECFGDGGARLDGQARWCGRDASSAGWEWLLSFVRVAAGGASGSRSRVFAFVVADEIFLAEPLPSPEAMDISVPAAMAQEGGTVLPPTSAQTEFSRDHRVRAYVYGFEQNSPFDAAEARELDPGTHMRQAGIWDRLFN